jgi:hypothetical protein
MVPSMHGVDLQPAAVNHHPALHRHPCHGRRAMVCTHGHERRRPAFGDTVLRQPITCAAWVVTMSSASIRSPSV